MAKLIRYTLATVCFACCVGCLALWWRSMTRYELLVPPTYYTLGRHALIELMRGTVRLTLVSQEITSQHGIYHASWLHETTADAELIQSLNEARRYLDAFGKSGRAVFFPIWYPALIFALAGVGVLGFRRQFSIRSALIATTVVAALIAMAVIL